jgi:hypothetical protein
MRRDNRNQIGCGLLGLTESFSNYIPSIFKKPENIGFDRLGNKNLRTSPSPPNNSPSLILLSPLAMDFLCPTESFLWGPLKINDEAQGVRSQEPGGLLGPHCLQAFSSQTLRPQKKDQQIGSSANR